MKLPPSIAEPGASLALARQTNAAAGRKMSGDERTDFADVLSNLDARGNGSPSNAGAKDASIAVRNGATAAPSASGAAVANPANAAPVDALMVGPPRPTSEPAGAQARAASDAAQDDDTSIDSVLKRVGRRDDDAPAQTPVATASQGPVATPSLMASLAAQTTGSPVGTPKSSPLASPAIASTLLPGAVDKTASTTAPDDATAVKPPLVSEIALTSQLAPTTSGLPGDEVGARPPTADASVIPQVASAGAGEPRPPVADIAVASQLAPAASPSPSNGAVATETPTFAGPVPTGGSGIAGSAGARTTSRGLAGTPQPDATSPPPSSTVTASAVAPVTAAAASPDAGPQQDADTGAPHKDDESAPLAGPGSVPAEMPALASLSPPVRQVATALARLAAETPALSGAASVPDVATPRPTLARTLTLQMSPADLGTVAVRMHATGGALDVQLTASDPRTAGLLGRERDALAASLQTQHTTLHSLVIQDGSGTPQPGGHHATQGDTSGAGARAQLQGSDAGSGGDGRQRRERPQGQPGRENAADTARPAPSVPAGGSGRSLLV